MRKGLGMAADSDAHARQPVPSNGGATEAKKPQTSIGMAVSDAEQTNATCHMG